MGVDIFKHLVYRTGGIPYSIWDQNTQLYTELYNNLVEHYNIRDLKSKQINKICDLVHDQIKVVETESSRKMLINFKRDLYNERPLKKQVISQILSLLPLNIASEFQNYEEYAKKEKTIKETIISQFEKTYFQDIELIKDVCNRNDFKSGLLLSSEVLYNYSKHIDEHSKINAKKALGLWKYITRASTKTTPFSTLTNINVATTVELTGTYAAITKASNKILSKIRYNNYFLESLLQILINHPQLFRSFPIVLNPTLTSKNDFLKFVTNSKNTESFQTIKKTPILEYIINTLTENPNFSVRDLEERLLMVLDKNHNRSEVSQYIFELTQTGFLNIDIDLTGLDTDWEKKIILLIEQQSDFFEKNLLINISNTLSNLEKFRKMYADGGYVDREKLKNDIKNQFDLLFKNIAESVETKNDENVTSNYIHVKAINEKKHIFLHSNSRQNNDSFKNQIYEDSSKDIELIVDKERLTTFVNDINTLINTFSPYLNLKEESSRLYDTYIDNFGDKESLPLLDFYEFLYKNDSRKKEETSNHDSSKTNDKISQIIKAEFDKGNITVANHQVNIPMDFLSHFDNKYEKTNNHKSYGGFFQFYHDDKDKLLGVASSVLLPGKGKMISRFLHLFKEQVTTDLQEWNIHDLDNTEIYAENSDASSFNANLHPRLMPYEIKIPGGNTRSKDNLINVLDLCVSPDHEKKELILLKNGVRVFVFDLGFETILKRSNLFRLLCAFGNNTGYPLQLISNYFNMLFQRAVKLNNITIWVLPRVVFNKSVVLQRKYWMVPIETFSEIKKMGSHSNDADIYLEIQKLRLRFGIPNLTFIKVKYYKNNNNGPISRDDYKPQFINFVSPMSIKLFVKIISRVNSGIIIIEEMLPTSEGMLEINNMKYASETLVQWQ